MRELRERLRYRPAQGRFKVIILDEVHMMSTAAFNALLKTLEEPPAQVKFMLATTELRKVPATILCRCQTFHLKRVPQAELRAHFARIAGLEAVTIEPEALAMLARAADGSVRDGLSLLDQAIALGGPDEPVTAEAVRDMLGLADRGDGARADGGADGGRYRRRRSACWSGRMSAAPTRPSCCRTCWS